MNHPIIFCVKTVLCKDYYAEVLRISIKGLVVFSMTFICQRN